jgi:hypothetical protein
MPEFVIFLSATQSMNAQSPSFKSSHDVLTKVRIGIMLSLDEKGELPDKCHPEQI